MLHIVPAGEEPCVARHWEAFVAWFASPYWVSQDHFRVVTNSYTYREPRLLGDQHGDCPMGGQSSPTSLCDEYQMASLGVASLKGPGDHYDDCQVSHVLRVLDKDGNWSGLPPYALQLLLIQAAARETFPVQALPWIAKSLKLWSPNSDGTTLMTISALLPGHRGSIQRSALLLEEQVAVPAFAFPLAASLMPEISYRFAPIKMSFEEWKRASSDSELMLTGDPFGLPRGLMRPAPVQLKISAGDTGARIRANAAMGLRAVTATRTGRWVRSRITDAGLVKKGTGRRMLRRLEESRHNPFMSRDTSTLA